MRQLVSLSMLLAPLLAWGCGSATLHTGDGGGQGGGGAGVGGGAGAGGAAGSGGGAGASAAGGHGGGGGHQPDAAVDGPAQTGTGGAASWCTQQAMPAGVAAADYACLDFDDGKLPSAGGWSSVLTGSNTSVTTMQRASSLPYSWQPSAAASDGSNAALKWHDAGAQAIASVTVAADLSPVTQQGVTPPWTGSVSLMCVAFGNSTACLRYTMGDDTSWASGYTGYYMTMEYDGGGAAFSEAQVFGTVQANLWTRVQLQVTASSKQILVTIPGATNTPLGGIFDPDTAVDVTVGPEVSGTTAGWTGYLDNIVVSVARSS